MASTPPPKSKAVARPRRRWRRRLLWGLGILVGVVLLLILLAPTIVTSRPAVRMIASTASGIIGREVIIEGLRFGWVTPFRLGKLQLPGNEFEDSNDLLHVEGVEVPLTLFGALRGGPYDLDGVRVARLEATAVRRLDGTWNFDDITKAFASDEAAVDEDEPDVDAVAEAIVLPLSRLGVRIDGISMRVVDLADDVTAGWVSGLVDLRWAGGEQPLTLETSGTFTVGQAQLPWRLEARAEQFADATSTLTPERTILTASTGGMVDESQIAQGGLFIHGGPGLRDGQSVMRVVLPLEPIARLIRESELPGADLVPPAEGEIVLRVSGYPDARGVDSASGNSASLNAGAGIARWQFDGAFIGSDMRAEIVGYEDLPSIDTAWNIDGEIDLSTNTLSNLAFSGRVIGFQTRVLVEELGLETITEPVGLSMEATLDFAEASRTVALAIGGDPAEPTPLDGHLSFSASATTITTDDVGANWTFEFRPGTLSTLDPFAPWPEQLGEAPRDLSPLTFALAGTIAHKVSTQTFDWEFAGTESPLVESFGGSGHYDDRIGTGNAVLRKVVELSTVHAAFGDVLLRASGIDSLEGRVEFETTSGIAESVSFLSIGQLRVQDLRLGMPEAGIALDEQEVILAWDTSTHLPTAAATVNTMTLTTEPATIAISGLLSPERMDVAVESAFNFDALAARGVFPDGIELVGSAQMALNVEGDSRAQLDVDLAVDLQEGFQYFQEGLLQIDSPAALRASTSLVLAAEPVRFSSFDMSELSIGDTLLGTLAIEWAEDNMLTGTASIEGAIAPSLAMMDPAFFAAMEMDILAEGDAMVRASFGGLLVHDETLGWQPVGDWSIDSDVAMDLAYAEWVAPWGQGLVEEAALSHQVAMTLPMDETGSFLLQDSGTLSAGFMDGISGLTLSNTTLESSFRMDDSSTSFTIESIGTDGGTYAAEGMIVRVPAVAFGAVARWNPLNQSANLVFSLLQGADLLDGEITTTYRSEIERWEASGQIGIPSIAAVLAILEFDPPAAFPRIAGGARVEFDLRGGIPSETELATGFLPIGGTAEWDIAIDEYDAGLDMQIAGFVAGGRIEFEEEEGTIATSGRLVVREFTNLALRAKPLRDIEAEFSADLVGFQSIQWDLIDLRVGNYGTTARASGSILDLNRALADTTREGLGLWLQNITLNGQLRAEQDLSGFTGFMPLLVAGGVVDLSFDFRSAPGAALITGGLVDLRNVELHWGELFHLEGANGSWEFAKALLLANTARRPAPPSAGIITVDRIAFGLPPYITEMRDTRASIRGLETPISIDVTSRNLIGGTASASMLLRMISGDPIFESRLQMTGLDIARIVLPNQSSVTRREWEVSAVSQASWRLRDVAGQRSLEDLSVSIQSTRIGTQAFSRLLQAMDPDETDPSIQQSRSALRLGTPTAARASMRTGLISFDADLRLAAGLQTILLPILNRQPIGDLLEVYQLQETMAVVPLARWGILLLMAEDLDTLERTLMQGGGTP